MARRVTKDTPDPLWAQEMRDHLEGYYLPMMLNTPFLQAAMRGRTAIDDEKMRVFLLLIGNGVIEPFRLWLRLLEQRAPKGSTLRKFARLNARQEQFHWFWWLFWGREFGLDLADFQRVKMHPDVKKLSKCLESLAMSGSLLHAVAAINFVVENLAGKMTVVVDAGIGPSLSAEGRLWLTKHVGDEIHGADAWELLKQLALEDPKFNRRRLEKIVDKTVWLYRAAIIAAYPEQSNEELVQKSACA